MKRNTLHVLLAVALLSVSAGQVSAWGRGGAVAYRGGAVGYRGGAVAGGYRGGAVAGGYHGAAVAGGYHGAAVAGGYHGAAVAGGYRGGAVAGGARVGAVGGARVGAVGGARVVGGGHTAMATDFGFGHVAGATAGRGFVATGHQTVAYSRGVYAARGTAVRGGFYHYGAFNTGWWAGHPTAWRPYGWTARNAWGWATWPALGTWFGWSAPPIYYDYGNTIVYQGDTVYVDGQPDVSAPVYYQQAADLALSAPPPPSLPEKKGTEWQPLGVFSLVQGEQADTNAVFQLAVNKAGIIRGNYYSVFTNTTLPVQGAVDRKTQRASWIVGDQKTTVYDTGIYNLTKDEAPVLIHFGKDRTQQWMLVRVAEKDGEAPPPLSKVEALPPPPPDKGENARVTVIVPADAEVYFEGSLTTATGTERSFNSPPLGPGRYAYSIRAVWTADGRPVEQTRQVTVQAGSRVRVDFTSPGS